MMSSFYCFDPCSDFYDCCDEEGEGGDEAGIENGDTENGENDGSEEPIATCEEMQGPSDPCDDDPFGGGDMGGDQIDPPVETGPGDPTDPAFPEGGSEPDTNIDEGGDDDDPDPLFPIIVGCFYEDENGVEIKIACPIDEDEDIPVDNFDDLDPDPIDGLDPDNINVPDPPEYPLICKDLLTGDIVPCDDEDPIDPTPTNPEPYIPDLPPEVVGPAPDTTRVGCMDPAATNYDELANVPSNACTYDIDPSGEDEESMIVEPTDPPELPPSPPPVEEEDGDLPEPIFPDGTGAPPPDVGGCMDKNAENFDPYATFDNGTCVYPGSETDPPPKRCRLDDGTWVCAGVDPNLPPIDEEEVPIDPNPPSDEVEVGVPDPLEWKPGERPEPEPDVPADPRPIGWDVVVGCMDPGAMNYDSNANVPGECVYPPPPPEPVNPFLVDPDPVPDIDSGPSEIEILPPLGEPPLGGEDITDNGLPPIDVQEPPVGVAGISDCEQQLFDLINNFRESEGLPKMPWGDDALSRTAWELSYANNNTQQLSHTHPDGQNSIQKIASSGYKGQFLAENVGQFSDNNCDAQGLFDMWKEDKDDPSKWHMRNMLKDSGRGVREGVVKIVGNMITFISIVPNAPSQCHINRDGNSEGCDEPEAPSLPQPADDDFWPPEAKNSDTATFLSLLALERLNAGVHPIDVSALDSVERSIAVEVLDGNLKDGAPNKPMNPSVADMLSREAIEHEGIVGVIPVALDPTVNNSPQSVMDLLFQSEQNRQVLLHPSITSVSVAWKGGSSQEQLVIIVRGGDSFESKFADRAQQLLAEYELDSDAYCRKYGCRTDSGVGDGGSLSPIWGCPNGSALDSRR